MSDAFCPCPMCQWNRRPVWNRPPRLVGPVDMLAHDQHAEKVPERQIEAIRDLLRRGVVRLVNGCIVFAESAP